MLVIGLDSMGKISLTWKCVRLLIWEIRVYLDGYYDYINRTVNLYSFATDLVVSFYIVQLLLVKEKQTAKRC